MNSHMLHIAALACVFLAQQAYPNPTRQKIFYDLFSLSATTTWKEYALATPDLAFHKEKWAWAYSFTIRSKQPLKFKNLILQWTGPEIENLSASLYQKREREEILLPIESNFVCEGIWNPDMQQMSFPLNQKVIAVNKYHLVLSYPKEVELKLRNGTFNVSSTLITAIHHPHDQVEQAAGKRILIQ